MRKLIHSLHASSTALLFEILESKHSIDKIYTIHACFACTAKNVKALIDCLKGVYIYTYIENTYIKTINVVSNTLARDTFTVHYKHVVYGPDMDKVPYPNLDKIIDLNANIQSGINSKIIQIVSR